MVGYLPYSQLQRMAQYLFYLNSLPADSQQQVSARGIADALGYGDVLVRKDLAMVSRGTNKIGRNRMELITELEDYLGFQQPIQAIQITDRRYPEGDSSWGGHIHILRYVSAQANEQELGRYCHDQGIELGIIDVAPAFLQRAYDSAVLAGITMIWNISPAPIYASDGVQVFNEVLNSSLIRISRQLRAEKQHTSCHNS